MTSLMGIDRRQCPGVQEGMESTILNLADNSDLQDTLASLRATPGVKRVGLTFYQLFQGQARNAGFVRHNDSTANVENAQCKRISRKRNRSDEIHNTPDSVGSLDRLEEITFSGGMTMHSLPVTYLTAMLRSANNLQILQLSRMRLQGDAEDFEDLARCLESRIALTTFILDDCKTAPTDTVKAPSRRQRRLDRLSSADLCQEQQHCHGYAINSILKALVSLPSVATIQVTAQQLGTGGAMGFIFPGTLEALCWSTSLKRLVLKGFLLNAQHIYAMGPGIATSANLEHVTLHKCCLLLENNNGKNTCKIDDCLTHMLQENTSLQHFEMPAITGVHNPRWVQMASKVLMKNTTLRVLFLGGPYQSTIQKHMLATSSSQNDALQSVQFHLKLNQAGRSQLLSKDGIISPKIDWVNAIGKVSDDLDCTLYFLSRNPSLCDDTSTC